MFEMNISCVNFVLIMSLSGNAAERESESVVRDDLPNNSLGEGCCH